MATTLDTIATTSDIVDFFLLRARDARVYRFGHRDIATKLDDIARYYAGHDNPVVRTTDPDALVKLPLIRPWIAELIDPYRKDSRQLIDRYSLADVVRLIDATLRHEATASMWDGPWATVERRFVAAIIGDETNGLHSYALSDKQREAFAGLATAWRTGNEKQIGYWQAMCTALVHGIVGDPEYNNPDRHWNLNWQQHNPPKRWNMSQDALKVAATGDIADIAWYVRDLGDIHPAIYHSNYSDHPGQREFPCRALTDALTAVLA